MRRALPSRSPTVALICASATFSLVCTDSREVHIAAEDYLIRLHDDPRTIDAAAWNDLLARQSAPTPFMRHEYLAALHASGSAVPDSGWAPRFVVLARDGALAAACPAYLKHHSWGEYVFDWAWADAYRRHGLAYYPKLLVAVPFTPVAGTRLLATDEAARTALLGALRALADDAALSSVHLLFADETDRRACAAQGWMLREGVQFHWTQDAGAPAADFDALLARMDGMAAKADRQVFGPGGVLPEVQATVAQLGGLLADTRASLKKVDAVLAEAQAVGANVREGTADLGALRAEVESNLRKIEGLVNDINRKWPFARDTELKLP